MKVQIDCMQCVIDNRGPESRYNPAPVTFEMRDDGFYDLTCPKGHTAKLGVMNPKYEVLFDLGVVALVDGYTRESVANIAAALERFCEHYIKVVCFKHGVEALQFVQTWKMISNQSERQLGAFLCFYLLENKTVCPYIKQNWIEFRNRVIHKGYIPSREEVIGYGEHILSFILEVKQGLETANEGHYQWAMILDWINTMEARGNGGSSLRFSTVLNRVGEDDAFNGFKDAVERVEAGKDELLMLDRNS